jgi:multiple antibiotic resistance protein
MLFDYAVSALVTLTVVVDPIGLVPVFVGLTAGLSDSARGRVARRASVLAFIILAAFALAGAWVLAQLGITLAAFRIAGGLLLFAIAFEMIYLHRSDRQAQTASDAVAKDHADDIAAFPLAIPLLAGPGAITATLLLAGRASGDPIRLVILLAIIAVVALLCLVVFRFAAHIARALGRTGNLVLSRLLGIVLAALAVQNVIDGVHFAFGG